MQDPEAGTKPEPKTDAPPDAVVARALRRAWFPVARAVDLVAPLRRVLLDEPLVVYRAADGRPVVQSDVCPHRGASMTLGEVAGDGIACAYHGWQFRADDGRCVAIPALGEAPAGKATFPSRAVLPTYRAEERHGLIWACLDEPLLDVPGPPGPEGRWQYDWCEPVTVNAGIRTATENFRDVAHFAFVHRGTMGELDPYVAPLAVRRDGIEVWMSRDFVAPGGSASAYGASFGEQGAIEFRYHATAPVFVFIELDHGPVGHRLVMNVASPISRDRCTIYLGAGIASDYRGGTVEDVVAMEAQVLAEDVPILDSIRPPEAPLDGEGQWNTASDRYTIEYRRAFLEFVRRATDAA
jgi:phenylpropionate dioxygenase-like ring-hydroxylating dioxygenase large terminal subunit